MNARISSLISSLISSRITSRITSSCVCWLAVLSCQPLLADEAELEQAAQTEAPVKSQPEQIEEVVVEAEQLSFQPASIDTSRLKAVAGAGNDILKAVEILPGVTLAGDGFGGEPVIRGSSPLDNQYYVNGVRVGYVFHNDGNSIFNPNVVANFDLYTGAWRSPFANAIGGVIDIQLQPDAELYQRRDSQQFTQLDLSFNRSGLLYANQISDNHRLYLSFRESLLFLYFDALLDEDEQDEEGIEFTQVPRNRDYQLSYIWDINDSYSLEFFASGAKDFIALNFDEDADEVLKDPDLLGGVDVRQAYNNQAFILRIDDDAYSANWRANALQQDIDLEVGQAIDLDGVVYNNAIMVDYRLAPQQDIDLLLGLELIEETFDYRARGRNQPCNEEFQVCPPSFLAPIIESKDKLRTQLPALFADMNWSLSDQLELNLGLRHSYISFSEQRLYEPRLGLTFFFSDQQRMWLRYGMHHQWFRGFEYGYIVDGFGTRELDVVEAEHFVAGFSQEQTSSWLGPYFWQFESYYKKLDKLVVANPDAQTDTVTAASAIAPYVNGASGEAYGFELLLRKDFSDAWQGWLTLAYSETNRDNDITGESFLFEFDQPWIINLAASYQLSRRVNVSAKWRYQSGNRYTDIIAATPIDDGNGGILAYDPIEGTLNGERFDASHRLDLRADVLISQGNPALGWRKPQIIAYFELLNAYGQKNQRGWDYEPDYSAREASYAFPEMPLPSIGFTFTF